MQCVFFCQDNAVFFSIVPSKQAFPGGYSFYPSSFSVAAGFFIPFSVIPYFTGNLLRDNLVCIVQNRPDLCGGDIVS
jgi:hypothetical protein